MLNSEKSPDFMAQVMQEFIIEQRRRRRWGIFFKLLIVAILALIVLSFCTGNGSDSISKDKPHTALINLDGEIMADAPFSADNVVGALQQAFSDEGTKAVILRINSPGGSPVQAAYIYNAIMRLRQQHPKVPVYAVCTDICASGAYYVASAANDIYANPASLVGSIGVIMEGFGFNDAIKKLGVSRRVIIAGKNKDFMDPFSAMSPNDKVFAQNMVEQVHQQFIAAVEQGRGNRLHKTPDIFTGLAWTGEQAKTLGLIDDFASAGDVARNIVKQENVIDYTIKPSPFERLANRMGASFANVMLSRLSAEDLKE